MISVFLLLVSDSVPNPRVGNYLWENPWKLYLAVANNFLCGLNYFWFFENQTEKSTKTPTKLRKLQNETEVNKILYWMAQDDDEMKFPDQKSTRNYDTLFISTQTIVFMKTLRSSPFDLGEFSQHHLRGIFDFVVFVQLFQLFFSISWRHRLTFGTPEKCKQKVHQSKTDVIFKTDYWTSRESWLARNCLFWIRNHPLSVVPRCFSSQA